MAVRNFTLDNFKFPNTSDITKKSEYYGFGTNIDSSLSYNEFTDNITMPITIQKAELIEENITIEKIEYDLKLLVSNGVVINLPTQNIKTGRKVTIIPKFISEGEEIKEGKATVSAGQYFWNISWNSFITFCWNGSFWYIDNNKNSYFLNYPSPIKFLEKALFGRVGKEWKFYSTDADFYSIAYDNGLWVAGSGSNIGLYYSTNGKSWTQSNITSGYFKSVAYGDDMWVAGGNSGLYYSMDGQTWTQSNMTSGDFESVVYANGLWVVGGNNTGLYYSTNGKTWTQSNITSGYLNSVAYGNGMWVAGSRAGLYYSEDGKTWTQSNITSGYFASLAYGDGMWVTGNNTGGIGGTGLYYSADGKNWSQSKITSGDFESVVYANGLWVAGGYNTGLYYSTYGQKWTQSNITEGSFESVTYANGVWVAGSGSGAGLYYSTDGKNFNKAAEKPVGSIAYGNLKIICTTDSQKGILISEIA